MREIISFYSTPYAKEYSTAYSWGSKYSAVAPTSDIKASVSYLGLELSYQDSSDQDG